MTKFRTVEEREAHYKEYTHNYNKTYRANNLEHCKKIDKAWKKANRPRINKADRLRRAKKKLEKQLAQQSGAEAPIIVKKSHEEKRKEQIAILNAKYNPSQPFNIQDYI